MEDRLVATINGFRVYQSKSGKEYIYQPKVKGKGVTKHYAITGKFAR